MPLLSVRDLKVRFRSSNSTVTAVHGVDIDIEAGEVVGLVGESGSGKTVTSLALMGLLEPGSAVVTGSATLDGDSLLDRQGGRRSSKARPAIAMVFQEPMTALDPVFTVGSQIIETLRIRRGFSRRDAQEEAARLLASVGIADPVRRLRAYPHEMSGGMRQRAMIAIALACDPRLLIADEPTTAVDVTIQAQLLQLLTRLARERSMAVLLVTHDLGVVAETCHRMLTMYAGRVVESGPVRSVLTEPSHPYTAGLLAALPGSSPRGVHLTTIPGRVPAPGAEPDGCVFKDRCGNAEHGVCDAPQVLTERPGGRRVRCARAETLSLAGVTVRGGRP